MGSWGRKAEVGVDGLLPGPRQLLPGFLAACLAPGLPLLSSFPVLSLRALPDQVIPLLKPFQWLSNPLPGGQVPSRSSPLCLRPHCSCPENPHPALTAQQTSSFPKPPLAAPLSASALLFPGSEVPPPPTCIKVRLILQPSHEGSCVRTAVPNVSGISHQVGCLKTACPAPGLEFLIKQTRLENYEKIAAMPCGSR